MRDLPIKKSFKQDAFQTENDTLYINDISYLMWLIMDIIKMFGAIKHNNIYEFIKKIFDVNLILLKNQSGNEICDQSEVKSIVEFLMEILVKFNLIINDGKYCKINFQYLEQHKIKLNVFTSILFKESFLKTKIAIDMKAKIINNAKKEGIVLWG